MSVFAIPALLAFLSKIGVYWLARKSSFSITFLSLLAICASHNLIEFVIVLIHSNDVVPLSFLKIYYVAALAVLAGISMFAMSVASSKDRKVFDVCVIFLLAIASVFILFTEYVIAGVISIGYSVTALKGSFYFVFQIFTISSLVFTFGVLLRRFSASSDMRVRLKCFYTLFSLVPLIVVCLAILGLMQLGVGFNGAVLLPFASSIFLLLIVLSERNHDLIRVRHYLLFSKARVAEKRILAVTRQHLHSEIDLSQAKLEFEKALVQYALDDSEGNVAWAADRLSVNRSSLYSMLGRLGIERNEVDAK